MQPTLTAVRAIGVEFLQRALRPILIIGLVVAVLLLTLGGWLTTQSAWWWLVQVPLIAVSLLFAVLALLARALLRRIGPALTTPQRRMVRALVDKLERSSEAIHTPYPVVLFYVIRDTIRPRPHAFIQTVAEDSRTLAPDFIALRQELSRVNRTHNTI